MTNIKPAPPSKPRRNDMKYEIKHRYSGTVLFSLDCDSFKLCVEAAVKANINLSCSDLSYSDLSGSNLSGSNLRGSNLSCSDLSGSNLSYSDLSCSDLSYSDLSGSDLSGSNLRGSKNIPGLAVAQTSICAEGDIIGYKKCREGIVKLSIPAKAKRTNATGRKCRAEYAVVLETPNGNPATSSHDSTFKYVVGETVRPNEWCEDRWQECAGGIHFYLTREEAEAH